jgi:hypothetical protein
VDGERLAVVWITFERVPKENELEFVRASHRGPMYDGSHADGRTSGRCESRIFRACEPSWYERLRGPMCRRCRGNLAKPRRNAFGGTIWSAASASSRSW